MDFIIIFKKRRDVSNFFLFDILEIEMVKVDTAQNKEKTKESEK